MPYFFQHFGVAVGALTGVLAGHGKRVDLFGVIVLAVVTGLGGGTLRDIILDIRPIVWIRDPSLLYTAIGAAVVAFALARVWNFSGRGLLIADGVALALYTVAGVEIAFQRQVAGVVAISMGVITGVAGGMIRDVLIGEIPLVFRRDIYLYATASLCGSIIYAMLRMFRPESTVHTWVSVGVILALRFGAIFWKWSLPLFHIKESRSVESPLGVGAPTTQSQQSSHR